MIITLRCVGIDVSKPMLDIFDDAIGAAERIVNASQPIAQQVARWRNNDVFVVFEATGVYDRALADALRQAGIRYARVNPARARDFARASGRLAKTDAIDARMLAAFARAMAPAADKPPEPVRNILAFFAKRRDQLVHMRAQEKNRRSEAHDPAMAEHIAVHIDFLCHEIEAIEAKIKALINAADIRASTLVAICARHRAGCLHATDRPDARTRTHRTQAGGRVGRPGSPQRR
jgi:transposase